MQLFDRSTQYALAPTAELSNYPQPIPTKIALGCDYNASILSVADVLMLRTPNNIANFIRNIIFSTTSKTYSYYKPSVEVYKPLFDNTEQFRIFSYPWKPVVLFGKWLDNPGNTNLIEPQNSRVNGYKVFFVFDNVIEYQNITYDPSNIDSKQLFIYFENMLLISPFKPMYEDILYPLYGNKHQAYLISEFEIKNQETMNYVVPPACKDGSYMTEWDLTIYRPKFLFSQNKIDWKVWDFDNNQWKDVTPSNNEYFTFDDFMNQAMTYSDYLKIPRDTAFPDDSDWYVMTNNYIPGFILNERYFEDFVGTSRFWLYGENGEGLHLQIYNL